METAWKFVRSGAIRTAVIEDLELAEVRALMARYADRPMDFAGATLVHLARGARLSTVFTVDHGDFETYRVEGRKPAPEISSSPAVGSAGTAANPE